MVAKSKFIKKPFPKDKVYSVWLKQLEWLEKSTIITDIRDADTEFEKSMDIVYKLFPIIDSISSNLLKGKSGRKYLRKLGYSQNQSDIIYFIFRNGIMHNLNPYEMKYNNGVVSWGLSSSGGNTGFTPHYPGYKDNDNPEFNEPADSAFICTEINKGEFHVILSLDSLVSQIMYDLTERQKNDPRSIIDVVVGKEIKGDFKW